MKRRGGGERVHVSVALMYDAMPCGVLLSLLLLQSGATPRLWFGLNTQTRTVGGVAGRKGLCL